MKRQKKPKPLEGNLISIDSVNVENTIRRGHDYEGISQVEITTTITIQQKNNRRKTRQFHGIILPDSLGHQVRYEDRFDHDENDPFFSTTTADSAKLTDLELNRVYSGHQGDLT